MPITNLQVRTDLLVPKRQRRLKHQNGNRVQWSNRNTVNKEVKEWIHETIKSHWYLFENSIGQLFIAFHDENEAMLFKLTWH